MRTEPTTTGSDRSHPVWSCSVRKKAKRKRSSPLTVKVLKREGRSVKPSVDVPLQGATQNPNDIRTLPCQVTVSKFFRKQRNTPPVPNQPHHVPDHRFGHPPSQYI